MKSSKTPYWSDGRGMSERTSDEPFAEMTKTIQRIEIAAGHGGYELKEHLIRLLRVAGLEVIDCGDRHLSLDDDSPDFVVPLARHWDS